MTPVIGYQMHFNVQNNSGHVRIKLANNAIVQLNINSIAEQIAVSALLALMPKVSFDGQNLVAQHP